jgi:hypothetical protein
LNVSRRVALAIVITIISAAIIPLARYLAWSTAT